MFSIRQFFISWILLMSICFVAHANESKLPADWDGVWKGMTVIDKATGTPEQVAMELHVSAIPGSNSKSWKILYGTGPQQTTRNYEIAPVANQPNHFIIDEKNGLFIDNQLIGNVLYSSFLVNGNLVSTRFELKKDQILVEITMFDSNDARKSKLNQLLNGKELEVSAYRMKIVQHGVLTRQQLDNKEKSKN